MSKCEELSEQTQKDLLTWYNVSVADEEDKKILAELYNHARFRAWDCPECGERVYCGESGDWYDFQGVLQQDFTSYPGNTEKYKDSWLRQLCDNCRMNS